MTSTFFGPGHKRTPFLLCMQERLLIESFEAAPSTKTDQRQHVELGDCMVSLRVKRCHVSRGSFHSANMQCPSCPTVGPGAHKSDRFTPVLFIQLSEYV